MTTDGACALLTGGIGAGKSTAAAIFSRLGAAVVSADEAGHRAIGPGGAARDPVARRWPEAVSGGEIDRAALAAIVFSDPGALAELEALTHPAIRADVLRQVDALEAPLLVVEIPLPTDIFGRDWPRIVVDAPDEVRVARLLGRGMDPDDIARRMSAQPPRAVWLEAADHVVDNSAGLDHLEAQCRRAFRRFASSGAPPGEG